MPSEVRVLQYFCCISSTHWDHQPKRLWGTISYNDARWVPLKDRSEYGSPYGTQYVASAWHGTASLRHMDRDRTKFINDELKIKFNKWIFPWKQGCVTEMYVQGWGEYHIYEYEYLYYVWVRVRVILSTWLLNEYE